MKHYYALLLLIMVDVSAMEIPAIDEYTPLLKAHRYVDLEAQEQLHKKNSISFSQLLFNNLPRELLYELIQYASDSETAVSFLLKNITLSKDEADKTLMHIVSKADDTNAKLRYIQTLFAPFMQKALYRFQKKMKRLQKLYRTSNDIVLADELENEIGTLAQLRHLSQVPSRQRSLVKIAKSPAYFRYIIDQIEQQDKRLDERTKNVDKLTALFYKCGTPCKIFYGVAIPALVVTGLASLIAWSILNPRFDWQSCNNFYANTCLSNTSSIYNKNCNCNDFNHDCFPKWPRNCTLCWHCCWQKALDVCNTLNNQFYSEHPGVQYWSPLIITSTIFVIAPLFAYLIARVCVKPAPVSPFCKQILHNYKTEIRKLRTQENQP